MSRVTASGTAPDVPAQLELFSAMVEIRSFEDTCHRLFAAGEVRGTTHLGQGQEAVSVGACRALRPGDTMTCTYRGHAAVLAMGASIERAFAELLGKANGLCAGKGGSMHLTDAGRGALGSFAIVGAHLPVTVGAAFAARYKRSGAVSLAFFGDASSNIGAFHEALNLASIWRLPAIFVCENNLYGEYSPLATTTPITRLADRADAYGMAKATIDGNDVLAVHDATSEAIERAVAGEGPTLLEALTYRHKGHSRSDPATYRPHGELERWLERDPILVHERHLLDHGVDRERLDALQREAEARVAEALERARRGPDARPESRLEHVFT